MDFPTNYVLEFTDGTKLTVSTDIVHNWLVSKGQRASLYSTERRKQLRAYVQSLTLKDWSMEDSENV